MPDADAARTTVVVVTRDNADLMLHTIDMLLELRPQPPIIVLDNASRDDTVARLHDRRYVSAGVRVIRMAGDIPSVARNLGVDLARSEFVAFCAEGTWWAGDALRTVESIFDAHREVGVVTAQVCDAASGEPDELSAAMAGLPAVPDSSLPGPPVLAMHTGASVARRSAYLRTGGFDPMLHLDTEEKLLAYDFAAQGWQLCYVHSVRAFHVPVDAAQKRLPSRRLALRDEVVLAWIRRPVRECLRRTAALLRRATHDGAALLALFGAARRFAWAIVERDRLPADVEHRIRTAERSKGVRR